MMSHKNIEKESFIFDGIKVEDSLANNCYNLLLSFYGAGKIVSYRDARLFLGRKMNLPKDASRKALRVLSKGGLIECRTRGFILKERVENEL